jgi:DNA-binding MarR family transcriptional regulator
MLTDDSAKQVLINEVMELQWRADQVLKPYVPDVWMELNLTLAQLKSLIFIANEGRTSSGKLAAALHVTRSNVTGIVDRLVEHGFISRIQNPEDRRSLLLQPTSRGEAALARLREGITSHVAEALKGMSMEELLTLSQGLTSLVRAAEEYKRRMDEEKALVDDGLFREDTKGGEDEGD